MSEHKRLHPLSIIFNILKTLKDAVFPFVIVIFTSIFQGSFERLIWLFIGIPVVVVLAVGWGLLSWWRYHYIVEEGILKVERGVLYRQKQYIALSRIQTIDEVEGLLQRLFGVVKLQVQTAGGQKPEAIMSAVSRKDADQLRRQLFEQVSGQMNEVADVAAMELVQPMEVPVYRLSGQRLLIMAITSGSIGVMASFLIAGFSQIGNLVGDSHILAMLVNSLLAIPVIFMIFVVLFVSWVLAIMGTVLKYYGFTIRLSGEKLHISRGLLERRQVAIPQARIQAIRIVESPLRQPFGWLSVYVESAGYGSGKGESTLLFPMLKRSELAEFIAIMIPHFQVEYELNRLPRRSLSKYITIHALVALLVSAPFCYFAPWGLLALLLVPISMAWGYIKYLESGWTWNEDNRMLIMQSRLIDRTIVLIPSHRIQYLKRKESLFQRRAELATIVATVASNARTGSSYQIKHIANEDSIYLLGILRHYGASTGNNTSNSSSSA